MVDPYRKLRKSIEYDGVLFESHTALAEHLGVTQGRVSQAIRAGRMDTLGTSANRAIRLQLPLSRDLFKRIKAETPEQMTVAEYIVKAILEEEFPE